VPVWDPEDADGFYMVDDGFHALGRKGTGGINP